MRSERKPERGSLSNSRGGRWRPSRQSDAGLSGRSLLACLFLTACLYHRRGPSKEERQRRRMVENQIIARGVREERVTRAMRVIPRHEFLPDDLRGQAYDDRPLSIGYDQTISQPYMVALMTEQLLLKPADRVLEIGTGCGYQTAILASVVQHVHSIEIIAPLAAKASETLAELGFSNVSVRVGDGYQGWKEEAPFDAIIVTCAPDHIPPPLVEQLKEGGRMAIPVGGAMQQELCVLSKRNGEMESQEVLPVRFVPMTGGFGRGRD